MIQSIYANELSLLRGMKYVLSVIYRVYAKSRETETTPQVQPSITRALHPRYLSTLIQEMPINRAPPQMLLPMHACMKSPFN